MLWRRSFDVPPPPIDDDDEFSQAHDVRYADLGDELPRAECLKDVIGRLLPYWDGPLADDLRAGRLVLVAAHGNSLRAIVKHLDGISDDDIAGLNIPTGMPLVYELDDDAAADREGRALPRPRRGRRGRRRGRQPGPLRRVTDRFAHDTPYPHRRVLPRTVGYTTVKAASARRLRADSVATGNCPVTTKTTRLATDTAWSAIRS